MTKAQLGPVLRGRRALIEAEFFEASEYVARAIFAARLLHFYIFNDQICLIVLLI